MVVILTASQIPASGFLTKTPPLPWIGCLLLRKENNRTQRGIPSRNGKAWWKNFLPFFPFSKAPNRGQVFGAMWEGHPKWLTVSRGSPGGPISATSAGVSFVTTWCGPCAHGARDVAVAVGETQFLMEGSFRMPPREGHFPKTNSKKSLSFEAERMLIIGVSRRGDSPNLPQSSLGIL